MKHTLKQALAMFIAVLLATLGPVGALSEGIDLEQVVSENIEPPVEEAGPFELGDLQLDDGGVSLQEGLTLSYDEVPEVQIEDELPEDIGEEVVLELEDVDAETPVVEEAEPTEPFDQALTIDGAVIAVTAEAGVFPEGAALRVEAVNSEAVAQAVEAAVGVEGVYVHRQYRVEIVDGANNVILPDYEQGVPAVRMEGLDLTAGSRVAVYDETVPGAYEIDARMNEGAIVFELVDAGVHDIFTIEPPMEAQEEAPVEGETEEPAQQPAEDEAEEPAQQPTEGEAEELAEQPTEDEAEEPAQQPTEGEAEELAEQPTEDEAEEPAQQPTEGEAEEPAQQPTEDETEEPAQQPAEDEAEEPAEQPGEGEAEESAEDEAEEESTDEVIEEPAEAEGEAIQPVSVVFDAMPKTAVVMVWPVANGSLSEEAGSPEGETKGVVTPEAIPAQEDGSFALLPGEYTYTAEAEGYVSLENMPFTVTGDEQPLLLSFALEAVPEEIPEPVAFEQSQTVNGVIVTVRAEPGVFPNGAELSVKRVPVYKQRQADAAVEEVRDENQNVAVSYTFDIKVIDPATREELRPAEGQTVNVSFALAEVADENLETSVYHIDDSGAAEKLDVTQEDEVTASVETEGFSLYTVEFTYNTLEYVLPGDSSVAMSEILSTLGLTGAVEAVEISDASLFSASNETGEWIVTAHQPFDTTEWMKVTINGVVYEITVTDTETSATTVGGTDYTLFTGFTATAGTTVAAAAFNFSNMVDGNLSSSWHLNNDAQPYYIEFNSDDPIIPKGYIFNTYDANNFKPTDWVLKAKADAGDSWTTLSSKSGQSLASGQEFQYACNNSGNNAYKYFRFEVSESSNNIWLTEIRLYGSSPDVYYTHLTVKAATCTETGIKQDCYQRNNGKYFTDKTGATELAESDVIAPMIPHSGERHEATDVNIEYWQCSMCGKYFSDEACTTEITEEDTKIYRTITIDDGISGLVMPSVDKALTGTTIALYVDKLIDTSTLQVNNGSVTLTDEEDGTYTFIVPAADVTVTASTLSTYSITLPANMAIVSATNAADPSGKYISGTVIKFVASAGYEATNVSDGTNTLEPDAYGIYTVTVEEADINITATTESNNTIYLAGATSDLTAVGGNILIGSTDYTVTIADGANVTLNNATINGGVVCEGSATITLVGTNSVSNTWPSSAGIQIGGSSTMLTIKGDGSLTATGGEQAAGIGLGRTWDANATGGSIVIEGGTVSASGGNGIGTGTVGNSKTAQMDGIIIKGGTVNARLGSGYIYNGSSVTIGAIKIYDTIDKVDASAITESVTYMHDETDVTASASTYFTIIEDGDRRVITPKDDTDYTITIADDIEHGSIACAAETAKYGDKVTITATPDFGYHLSRLVVKDAENNDLASTSNTFFMPKGNVTVSAVFEQGTHGTTEFVWGYFGPSGFVREASIYDGLTTVNLQQGQSYQIIMYDESSYRAFLLDNNTYNANIPYSSGTGTFPENGNGTNFSVDYNGESGFYDITMTDVGNGKWNVSILKTVAAMDNIPDQTYTGNEITPEPLVMAGSLNLTKGTDYEYSYTDNTNVGTAKVTVTFKGDYASLGSVEKDFNIHI